VTAGGAIGQGIVPWLAQMLITAGGWRNAALWLGAGSFVTLVPLVLLLKPAPIRMPVRGQSADANLWRKPHNVTIPWLALGGFFCCVCMVAPLVHLVPLGISIGCTPQTAAELLLALMIAGVFGRLFFGWLADRIGGLAAYFTASLAQTLTVFWFTQTADIAVLFQLSVLFGFGFAGVMTCLLICAREAAPPRLSGTAMAVVSTAGWIGMGLGGYQAGLFYDLTASYLVSYANAALAGLINLLIIVTLGGYRHRHAWRRSEARLSRQ
jgi:predicted MFS family arabinose efflux permease